MPDAAATGVLILLAVLPLGIWLYLVMARGSFWRVDRNLPPACLSFRGNRRIAVVIPARDEAPVIADTITSLRNQQWRPSSLRIFLVDDNSGDGTAEAAASAGGDALTIIRGKPLEPGWTGKLWALSQGVEPALDFAPDYLLFTDADIQHDPQSLAGLVGIAEEHGYSLVSFMVKLSCGTLPEKLLIPAFVFFFFQLYPPSWIRSQRRKTAGAAGGCVLIRPEALQAMGGLDAIRSELIDDCALANAVKRSGGSVWLGLSADTRSTRVYETFAEVGSMISRTAFNQLRHSLLLLLGTVLGLCLTFLLPVALLFVRPLAFAGLGAASCLLMVIAYRPMVRFYGLAGWWALSLPLAAVFYLGATTLSAIRYWRGAGGAWKGRAQDLAR